MIKNMALTASVMCAAAGIGIAPLPSVLAHAQAQELAAVDAVEHDFGQRFTNLSGQFGLPVFEQAVKTKRGSMLYSYGAAEGAKAIDAEGATVTVFTIDAPTDFLKKYVNSVQSEGVVRRELDDMKLYGQDDTLVAYTQYHLGRSAIFEEGGPEKKYYLSMVWQVLPGVVANYQIEKDNEPFMQETIGLFEQIVKKTAETQADRLEAAGEKQG